MKKGTKLYTVAFGIAILTLCIVQFSYQGNFTNFFKLHKVEHQSYQDMTHLTKPVLLDLPFDDPKGWCIQKFQDVFQIPERFGIVYAVDIQLANLKKYTDSLGFGDKYPDWETIGKIDAFVDEHLTNNTITGFVWTCFQDIMRNSKRAHDINSTHDGESYYYNPTENIGL